MIPSKSAAAFVLVSIIFQRCCCKSSPCREMPDFVKSKWVSMRVEKFVAFGLLGSITRRLSIKLMYPFNRPFHFLQLLSNTANFYEAFF